MDCINWEDIKQVQLIGSTYWPQQMGKYSEKSVRKKVTEKKSNYLSAKTITSRNNCIPTTF